MKKFLFVTYLFQKQQIILLKLEYLLNIFSFSNKVKVLSMGRKSNEDEICEAILNELYDISEKRGITFNKLFNKIKQKRGKFSYDTLSKYLNKMEQDGRIIRVIDVNSNKKIKPTLLYKNSEIVHLRNQKINFKNIFMDKHTKIHKLAKERLKNSDLFPKFNELILKFLDEKMNINVDHLNPEAVMNWNIILENFEFFSIENPEIKEIDLNPVIVHEKGASIVDARIII